MKILNWIIRLFKQRNKGFSERKTLKQIKKDGDHYSANVGELGAKFGSKFKKVNPGGHWKNVKIKDEKQRNKFFDSFGCTVYANENIVQILIKFLYGIFEEYSERYNGVLANLKIGFGGSPHTAAETIRKQGLLPYEKLPFDESIKNAYQYYTPKPMTQAFINEGKKWLDRFEYGHEWFWDFSHKNMMKMLKYSPLGSGV